MIEVAHLAGLVADHVPRQRWGGAGGRTVATVELVWCDVLEEASPALAWLLAEVTFDDESSGCYQIFVGARGANEVPDFLHGKEREILGAVDDVVYYDALIDPELALRVLHLVAPDQEAEVPRPLVLEQTHSSVVYDERLILKVFRRVVPGPNPDVQMTRELSSAGFPHVLAPVAELSREGNDLAVLREFLIGAAEGWQLARNSVRDVLASRLAPAECGGDFAADAERLGIIVGELHVAMDGLWGHEPADPAAWAQAMVGHLDGLAARHPALPFDADAVAARYRSLAEVAAPGASMRIHGDLHLAQAVQADAGWFVLDFEGEPARRRDQPFTVSSPLRDVAGMLRSIHYASASGIAEWDEHDTELIQLAVAWEERNRNAFLQGYLAVDGVASLLPPDEDDRRCVLCAFELDKAVYEVGYELAHRPEWVEIPAGAIARALRA